MDLDNVRKELLNHQAIIVDVREQQEWDQGHLPQAKLIPLSEIEAGHIPEDLPNNKTIYLHCRRGGRAEQAAHLLKDRFPNVVALKTSFDDLKKEKYPLGNNT